MGQNAEGGEYFKLLFFFYSFQDLIKQKQTTQFGQ